MLGVLSSAPAALRELLSFSSCTDFILILIKKSGRMVQLLCIFVVFVFLQAVHQARQLAECKFYIVLSAVFSFLKGLIKIWLLISHETLRSQLYQQLFRLVTRFRFISLSSSND